MESASLSSPSSTLSWTPVGLCFPASTGNLPQPWQIWTSIVTNRHEGRLEVRSQSLTGCVYRDTRPGASEPLLICSGLEDCFSDVTVMQGLVGRFPGGSNPRAFLRLALMFWALEFLVATGPGR